MKHTIRLLALLIIVLSIVPLWAQSITLQIAASVPPNSPWDIGMKKLASEWARVSNGNIKIVFSRSLANASQDAIVQQLTFGIDGALLETSGMFLLEKDTLLLSMPGIIKTSDEFIKASKALLPVFQSRLADKYQIITLSQGGWIRFFSIKPIKEPSDFVGIRIGVNKNQEPIIRQLQILGAKTVKSDSTAFVSQFSSKALDVVYSSPLLVATFWNQLKSNVSYMSAFTVSPFFGGIVLTKRAWDKIPKELHQPLIEVTEKVAQEITALSLQKEHEAINMMTSNGLLIPALTGTQLEAWNELFTGAQAQKLLNEMFTPATVQILFSVIKK